MISPYIRVKVECYAGYRGDEEPRRFVWGGKTLEITEIIDRWLDPNHRYFKVRSGNAELFILRHDPNSGEWELREIGRDPADETGS